MLASCTAPSSAYALADRDTFNAVAPEYQAYVLADGRLSQLEKDRRLLTVETWRMRLAAAEGVK